MYKIILTNTFDKEIKKLETKDRERIKKKLYQTKLNPWLYFEKLTGHDLFRLQVGKYRIISQINLKDKQIILVSVNLRKKVYQKL